MAWVPKILAFVCTYCTYTAADMAGSARMQYPATVRIVKYLCTGSIDILHILKACEAGADGVLVSGCEAGSCHFLEGNLRARERIEYAQQLLEETGLGRGRLEMFEIAASDAPKWVAVVQEMTQRVKHLGPNPLRQGRPLQHEAVARGGKRSGAAGFPVEAGPGPGGQAAGNRGNHGGAPVRPGVHPAAVRFHRGL